MSTTVRSTETLPPCGCAEWEAEHEGLTKIELPPIHKGLRRGIYLVAGVNGHGEYRQLWKDAPDDPSNPVWDELVRGVQGSGPYVNGLAYATGGVVVGVGAFGLVGGGLSVESLSIARAASSNTLHHIFGKAGHKLAPLVARFGSQEGAFSAVLRATDAVVRAKGITGIFELTVRVAGQSVVVRGNVINGLARIGTFFIP